MQLDPKGIEEARKAIRYLSSPGTPWSDEQVGAVISSYLSALPSPEPTEAEVEAPPKGIDGQVWVAAHEMDAAEKANPEWLFYEHDSGQFCFGRWSKVENAAPYIRADIALAASRSRPAEAKAGMVNRDKLADAISRAGAPPGPPDGPIGALPPNHFERVRAYKQADAVLAILSAIEPVAEAKAEPVAWRYHYRNWADGVWQLVEKKPDQRYFDAGIVEPLYASPTPPALTDRAEIIEWCADEIEVLQQSLVGACNRSFNEGDQGSAIILRNQADGIKAAVGLLNDKAAAVRAHVRALKESE